MMEEDYNPISGDSVSSTQVATVMQRVFSTMTLGLGITAATSFFLLHNVSAFAFAIKTMWVWLIAELVLVFFLSLKVNSMGTNTARLTFYIYAIINGITLTPLCYIYTESSIVSTFLITAGVFGAMAVIGKTTKMDLTKLGSFLIMALFGVIIASIVNIFIRSNTFEFVLTVIGLLIFIGLTAYDIQKIKRYSEMIGLADEESITRVSVMGALSLYLDFINIFIKLLSLTGKRRK